MLRRFTNSSQSKYINFSSLRSKNRKEKVILYNRLLQDINTVDEVVIIDVKKLKNFD
jgi:hypothetical protein